uniref:glucan endo-1,3-beta-D-glucosidase n=1 Tax=Fagus sylvatica TaxID=28930 RepID=A0A2N9EHC2_FAGSY
MKMSPISIIWIALLSMAVFHNSMVFGGDVGVNYGRLGNDLPSPTAVVDFLTKNLNYAIPLVRIFDADIEVLEAFRGTNLVVTVGVLNEEIIPIASSLDVAKNWVNDHIARFNGPNGVRFRYITVGNEAIPGIFASSIPQAMKNIYQALRSAGLPDYIQVTTVLSATVLGQNYPPSIGTFSPNISNIMDEVSNFVYDIGSPLLYNAYPYYAIVSEPTQISLDFALFRSQTPVVIDGNYQYYNLFDAMVDAFVAAMVRAVGKEDVKVVVSETGWPTEGDEPYTTIDNANIYNNNLREHVMRVGRTPRRADLNLEAYIFAMFNENLKPDLVEQNWGTFYPNFTEVYQLWH